VDISSAQLVDSSVNGGDLLCPAAKPAVCGLKNPPDHTDFLDQLYCCAVHDIKVDFSGKYFDFKDYANGDGQWKGEYCDAGYVMCGAKYDYGNNAMIAGVYCCPATLGESTTDCAAGIDGDNDGLKGCSDPDCSGKIGPDGAVCGTCGDKIKNAGEDCDDGPSGSSTCTSSCKFNTCGDGANAKGVNHDGIAETCDNGTLNGESCTASSYGSCTYCESNCNIVTLHGSYCGDGISQSAYGETCDWGTGDIKDTTIFPTPSHDGLTLCYGSSSALHFCLDKGYSGVAAYLGATGGGSCSSWNDVSWITSGGQLMASVTCSRVNGDVCTYSPGASCQYCNTSCVYQTARCGDHIRQPSENSQNCLVDAPVDGWTTTDTGWSADNGVLNGTKNQISMITTYGIDVKADTNYTVSFNVLNPTSDCNAYVDFDGGNCMSADGWIQKKCFDDIHINLDAVGRPLKQQTRFGLAILPTISFPSSIDAINGTFKNVHLRIVIDGCAADPTEGILFDNVALAETKAFYDKAYQDLAPAYINDSSACCPSDYCWDGKTCVGSSFWMGNATYGPVWNSILNYSKNNWTNTHVNTTNQSEAVGYRCVIQDSAHGADWAISKIKYDWEYTHSGYCALDTDCFATENSITNLPTTPSTPYSRGCVHDGDIISDRYSYGSGNHYCYKGSWTTRSYLVATMLQNLSGGKPYILHCNSDLKATVDASSISSLNAVAASSVISSCVLIKQDPKTSEQILSGMVIDSASTSGGMSNADTFLDTIRQEYYATYKQYPSPFTSLSAHVADCIPKDAPGTALENFSTCIKISSSSRSLYVYYEKHYNYFIISDEKIDGLTPTSFIDNILNFFKNLFGGASQKYDIQPYNAISFATSYDHIYMLNNGTGLVVTGIEEAKYDELSQKVLTTLYLHYNLTNQANNQISVDDINATLKAEGITPTRFNYTLDDKSSQEILIRTDKPTGLWPYLTTILRHR